MRTIRPRATFAPLSTDILGVLPNKSHTSKCHVEMRRHLAAMDLLPAGVDDAGGVCTYFGSILAKMPLPP
jgi:hypothetical protein